MSVFDNSNYNGDNGQRPLSRLFPHHSPTISRSFSRLIRRWFPDHSQNTFQIISPTISIPFPTIFQIISLACGIQFTGSVSSSGPNHFLIIPLPFAFTVKELLVINPGGWRSGPGGGGGGARGAPPPPASPPPSGPLHWLASAKSESDFVMILEGS